MIVILRRRWPTGLLIGFPLALVAGAYLWLAVQHRRWDLWDVVVHESGRYTLSQTILFFRHFLREVPVDIAMGLFCAAAVTSASAGVRGRTSPIAAALLALALVAIGFAFAARDEGARAAMQDLLQYRTRDDDLLSGAHWSFHWLSTIWFGAAAFLAAAIWAGHAGPVKPAGWAAVLQWIAWGWVLLLTVIYGVQREVFTSPRYIGHQAREILTHGLITLPLTVAVLRAAAGGQSAPGRAEPSNRPGAAWVLLPTLAAIGIPAFLLFAFRSADLETTAQMHSALAGVVAGHVFEHLLDIVLVMLVGLAAIGGSGRPATGEPAE